MQGMKPAFHITFRLSIFYISNKEAITISPMQERMKEHRQLMEAWSVDRPTVVNHILIYLSRQRNEPLST